MTGVPEDSAEVAARKAGLLRSSVTLLAGVVALTVLAMLLRDYHRRSHLMNRTREYAEMLAHERVGDTGGVAAQL